MPTVLAAEEELALEVGQVDTVSFVVKTLGGFHDVTVANMDLDIQMHFQLLAYFRAASYCGQT